jgi:hypothetical protein
VCRACRNNVFRRLSMHGNARSGLLLRDSGTGGNQVLDSDFFGNGIGLGIMFGDGTGNLVRGNRAYDNGSAGFDTGEFAGAISFEYNWSFGNAKSGFVLAGGDPVVAGPHRLRHNAAWDNAGEGFSDEGGNAALELSNNTAFRNGGDGFRLRSEVAVVRSNASIDNGRGAISLSATAAQSRNSWQQDGWSAATFRSTDPAEAASPRQADWRFPRTAFLTTGNGVGASMTGPG